MENFKWTEWPLARRIDCGNAAIRQSAAVRYWHLANMSIMPANVRFRGQSGHGPSRMCCYRLSFDAGLLVLDTPHKIITDTA